MQRSDDNPELNPLLNPVLSANMGRWAGVYVTTPPEERDEAVLELLRELRAETSQASQPAAKLTDALDPLRSTDNNALQSSTCGSCGRSNPARHRFCGTCGADILQSRSLSSPPLDPEPERRVLAGVSETDRNPFGEDRVPDEGPKLIPDYEPSPYRYRVYAGAVMAVLVSALVYVAWRGTQGGFGGSHAMPAAVPAAAPETSPQPQATLAPKADTTAAASHPASEPGAPATAGSASANDSSQINSESKAASTATPARASAAAKPAPPAQSARGNGSEELTIAENYLNGAQGKAPDRTEAAKWLWKSVAKQNSRAAVMLSDLYLRGNGVAKSCDQARLLLDSAARKGAAGAGERLRNLPAFGCR